CRKRCHTANGFFQREHLFFSYILAQHTCISAITAGVWHAYIKQTYRGIASKHVKGVLHDAFYILFTHAMKYGTGTTIHCNIHNGLSFFFGLMLAPYHTIDFFYAFAIISSVILVIGNYGIAEVFQFSFFKIFQHYFSGMLSYFGSL